jgi:hypothetical protein
MLNGGLLTFAKYNSDRGARRGLAIRRSLLLTSGSPSFLTRGLEVGDMEIWKDIPEYEGFYQASSEGRIRSLDRIRNNGGKYKGVIFSLSGISGLYQNATLTSRDGTRKTFTVHRLIYMAFNGEISNGKVIDHIDGDKSNNSIKNLREVSQRENSAFGKDRSSNRELPTGVYREKQTGKYGVRCCFGRDGGKRIGVFDTVSEAQKAYVFAVKNGLDAARKKYLRKPKFGVVGVSYCKTKKNFRAYGHVGKKFIGLGYFDSKELAISARLKWEHQNGLC